MVATESVVFPVSVQFEDGEVEVYESVEDLVCNLEDFDSDLDKGCKVKDSLGRPLRLKLELLDLRELSLLTA
jgi:hypothetical protein